MVLMRIVVVDDLLLRCFVSLNLSAGAGATEKTDQQIWAINGRPSLDVFLPCAPKETPKVPWAAVDPEGDTGSCDNMHGSVAKT